MFKKRRLKKEVKAVARITIGDETKLIFSVKSGVPDRVVSMYKKILVKKLECECIFIDDRIKLETVVN